MSTTRRSPASEPPPPASSAAALQRMARQSSRDTRPEIALRRALHARGARYRVDAPLPLSGMRRRADVLFSRARLAVFVDGCFWHGCPTHGTAPRANASWWSEKLARNRARDRDTDTRLREAGWTVIRVWEHEDAAVAAESIMVEFHRRRLQTGLPSKNV